MKKNVCSYVQGALNSPIFLLHKYLVALFYCNRCILVNDIIIQL